VSEKERKKKKSKTREICCDEVFVICPLQNSKKNPPRNSIKVVSPLKKWFPSNFDHFLNECLNCTIYYCFSKLPKFKSTTFFSSTTIMRKAKKNT